MISFFIGVVSYILAGLGLGGGVILIPMLIDVVGVDRISAQYISLLAYIPMGIILLFSSKKASTIYKIISIIPFGIIGAIIGALCANIINSNILRLFYSLFLIIFGLNLCVKVIVKKLKTKTKC